LSTIRRAPKASSDISKPDRELPHTRIGGLSTVFFQNLLVIAGSLGSLWILKKRFKKEDWPFTVSHGVLVLLFGALLRTVLNA